MPRWAARDQGKAVARSRRCAIPSGEVGLSVRSCQIRPVGQPIPSPDFADLGALLA